MLKNELELPVFTQLEMEDCCGCEACRNICPSQAICMTENEEGFLYPSLDKNKCIKCDRCIMVCPLLKEKKHLKIKQQYYAGYSQNKLVVEQSSSGGMFTIIVDEFLNEYPDGYISGVIWKDDFKGTKHICTNDIKKLLDLRRSKYIQSEKGDIYKQIKALLNDNQAVLFVGLPCETAGLISYLGNKKYVKLLVLDLVCQGPTSPKAMQQFVDGIEKKYHSSIKYINMRYVGGKEWIPQWMNIKFLNGKDIYKVFYETDIGRAVHIMQRKSCYKCRFNGENRYSDLTIGDYHGVNSLKDYYNRMGTSIALVNSIKGIKMLEKIIKKENVILEQVPLKDIVKSNPRILTHNNIHPKRELYTKYFKKYGLKKANKISRTIEDRLRIAIPYKIRPIVSKCVCILRKIV